AVVNKLGLSTPKVQVSTGYQLPDGYVMFPTRTVVAKLKDKTDRGQLQRLLSGFSVKEIVKKFGVYRITLARLDQAFTVANTLAESGLFDFAQPDFYAPIQRYQDPLFAQQFQMNNTGQTLDGVVGQEDADCNALEAWDISLGSSVITVAVIDDGLEAHEDFQDAAGNSRYTAGWSPANDGNGNPRSNGAHGVSCAGSIAASHNDLGVRGVAPLVNLISVNIFVGGESTQDIADGISWAKNQGADVLSNSWGYTTCYANYGNINDALADANENGRGGLGSVVVFASGNGYKNCVDFPARNPNVIAVGAFTNQGVRSEYSNAGAALDLMAPSNNVGGPGAGVRTTDRMGSAGYSSGNYTNSFGGTSSACPIVAGVAALVLGYNPSLTSTEVKNILYTTAIDMGPPGPDTEYANGRVNALGALQAAGPGAAPTCTDGIRNGQETGIDCGGPDCPDCPSPPSCTGNEVTLTILLDNYPEETSWRLANAAGQAVASGGTYGNQADGSTLTVDLCLAGGCYIFTILDAYGDGLCCGYGQGSYLLRYGSDTLAFGASFARSETTEFCLGNSEQDTAPPSPPSNLRAINPTETTIDLRWSVASDDVAVTGYRIYQEGVLLGTIPGTAVTVPQLSPCTSYSFMVTAIDAAGNESAGTTVTATTSGCSNNTGQFSAAYFETGMDGWVDGGSDCYRDKDVRSYEGEYCIRLRDNSGRASSMTSSVFDLSGLSAVEIDFYFYPYGMEPGEDFWVRYNDGSGWQTVATYVSGTDFTNNSYYNTTITLDASNFNLSTSGQFRIQCDADMNGDQVYVDQVILTGYHAANTQAGEGAKRRIRETGKLTLAEVRGFGEADFLLSPNPASKQVLLTTEEPLKEVSLYSITGQLLQHHQVQEANQLNLRVEGLPTGVYLVSILTSEERSTQRLVVRH
ncbi:MAG: S8 family serine peptidase, partial [Bacteroidota bacterium]